MSAIYRTQGIVLGYIPYKESSVIIKIYTLKFGIQTYIENNVRTAKGYVKMAHFQPLTLLDLVVYHNEKKQIHRISEHKLAYVQSHTHFDTIKQTIALFMCEVLSKCLKEESEQPELFGFIFERIKQLDQATDNLKVFHLNFLVDLSAYLGFFIESGAALMAEIRQANIVLPNEPHLQANLDALLNTPAAVFSKTDRYDILEALVWHYKINIPNFSHLKSIEVLKEVFT
jgi:DNA repair protein RecO (recombination protein O)